MSASPENSRSNVWKESAGNIRVGGTTVPFTYPRLTDPRLIQIAALVLFNILGQLLYGFRIHVSQILLVVLLAGLLDVVLTYARRRLVLFPASGLISGLSLALLLRVQDGVLSLWLYVFVAIVAIGSKHVLAVRGKHVFNPSNLAITVTLLLFGPVASVTPNQWQGSWWLIMLIVLAGIAVTVRARVFGIVVAFYITELLLFVVLPGKLFSFDSAFLVDWKALLFSPAILIFTFYMITDPRTAPQEQRSRLLYVIGVAALHWSLVQLGLGALSLFLALSVACCFVPLLEGQAPDGTANIRRLRVRSETA